MVYSLLSDYETDGESVLTELKQNQSGAANRFDYLDQPQFRDQLIEFSSGNLSKIILYLPAIHCSACIYLLENLPKIEPAVTLVRVDFLRKEAAITFDHTKISLKKLAELLTLIGYEPNINATLHRETPSFVIERELYIRLGVAGFCLGNIMLFALPDYFADGGLEPLFYKVFNYINFTLSFAILYSAGDYFRSAFGALRERVINMDVPIALGIAVLFLRSSYEVLSGTGTGFFDSLSGLVFFLLLGKIFQKKTYHTLSFERDYKSYFPISVTRVIKKQAGREETHLGLDDIRVGDRLMLKHGEIIPADSILMSSATTIDYSFVTGESMLVNAVNGERIFAGGKINGASVEIEVIKQVSQSYLTQLWNQIKKIDTTKKYLSELSARFARIFTWSVIGAALAVGLYWYVADASRAWFVASAVLIIACPCALALAQPFTFGAGMRIFGRMGLYLKNANIIESMASLDIIVFDKTGTLTHPQAGSVQYFGKTLTDEQWQAIRSVAGQSTHPLSRMIYMSLPEKPSLLVSDYHEIPSLGIEGKTGNQTIRIGSRSWISGQKEKRADLISEDTFSEIHVSVDGVPAGYFSVEHAYREGLREMMKRLKSDGYILQILSGDKDHERERLQRILGGEPEMRFQQSPFDKLSYVEILRKDGQRVLMIGDGLNDAGALHAGSVGMAMTDNIGTFTPNSDSILDASAFILLPDFLRMSKSCVRIVYTGYTVSFIYNAVGISLAAMGYVTPLLSAILMPISSVSVVALTVGLVKWKAFMLFKKRTEKHVE